MRPTRSGAGLLVAALVTAVPTSYAVGRAAADRPTVGECRMLTFQQVLDNSDSTAPIACGKPHDDRVIKVADLPSSGANWIRCDLVLLRGQGLKNLPTDATAALASSRLPSSMRHCLTWKNHDTAVCTATHNFRATGAFTVTGSYPESRRLATIARHRCPALVSTPKRFWFTYQPRFTRNQVPDHAVVCFSHRSD